MAAIAVSAGPAAHALTITAIFDSSITNDPNAATIEASINATIATYETMFRNPINLSINFSEMLTGLGQSTKFSVTDSYTDFRAKLAGSQTSTDDATALAHLPTQAANPVTGDSNIKLSTANAEALGIFTGSNTTSASIGLNTSIMNLSRGGTIDANKYDLVAVVEHEMNEILGLGSALLNGSNGQAAPTGAVRPMDLFRYDQSGARSFTTSASALSYFSIDGTTQIVGFNQTSDSTNDGDFGDWYSFSVAHTARVQDAYGTPGVILNNGTAEKTALDVIGYTMLSSLTWNPTSTTSGTPADGAGIWTTASGSRWWNGSANSVWSNGTVQNAQFGTPGTASTTTYTVTLGSPITVGTMVFGNANYTIAGGGNSLTINQGIITVANASITAPVILGGANSWETTGTSTLNVSGNVSGGFGLTKQGPGTLILSGSNSYTGGTTVNGGTLQLGSASGLPSAGNVTVANGALDLNGQSPSIGNLTFGDGSSTTAPSLIDSAVSKGSVTLAGDITYTGTFSGGAPYLPAAVVSANVQLAAGTHHITTADTSISANYDVVISGNLSGPGGLTKDGVNYLALTGANAYSGATVINNGWVFAAATNTLSSSSAVTVNSSGVLSFNPVNSQAGVTPGAYSQTIGSLAGNGQVQMGAATLTTGADNTSTTFSGTIFGAGGLTKDGTGTFIFSTGQAYSGVTTVENGILQLGNGGSTGSINSSSGVTGLSTGTLLFNYGSSVGFSTPIGGAVNVTQGGAGTLFLLGSNTFSGILTINSGTVLIVGNTDTNGTLGTGSTVNNGTLRFQHTDMLTVSSAISGGGAVQQNTSGGIILTGANTFTGQLTLFVGTVQIGNGGTTGSLASGTTVIGNTGTTLVFNRSDAFTVGSTLGLSNMAVTQAGTGTTTLSGTNSYLGATMVNAGTLLVTGSISGSTTAVNTGGTLAGTGTVGAVNAASGGTVLPGSSTSAGLLSSKSVSFASGSHFSLELGGSTGTGTASTLYSELKVTGSVTLGGDIQVGLLPGYIPQVNDIFYVILNDGGDTITNTFSNAPGGIFTSGFVQYQVDYAANGDGTANDVSIKVLSIPEPGVWTPLVMGMGMVVGWGRRRRR